MKTNRSSWPKKLTATVSVAFAMLAGTASADDEVFDQFYRYTESEHRELYGGMPDETIDPFSGTLHLVQTDIVLPGKAGLDLRIVRSYSSKIWNRTDDASLASLLAERETSVLGYGWSMHMGRIKSPNATGQAVSPCSGDYPVLEMPDGSARVFYRSSSSSSVFISRDYWRMEPNCSVMGGGGKGTCIWTTSGVRYEFSPTNAYFDGGGMMLVWPASKIADRFGNEIVINYVKNGNGAVDTITDSYNRSVSFTYASGTDGLRLSTMTVNSKVYNYTYTSYATIGGGSLSPRRFLTEVKPPAGSSYKYSYAINAAVANNQYALSSLTYPNGGAVNYAYSSSYFYIGFSSYFVPFAVVSTKTVNDRDGTGLASWQYEYVSPSNGPNQTTITRPDGLSDIYEMYGFGAAGVGSLWKVGLTRGIWRAGGAEVEIRDWEAGPAVSSSIYSAPAYTACAGAQPPVDNGVYVPRMIQRTVWRDGFNYTTAVSEFDDYGQPLRVSEVGQRTRTTTWTYKYAVTDGGATLNLVQGLPLSQRVCVDSSNNCFDNSWTYNKPHYARDSEILSGVTTTLDYDQYGNLAAVTNARGEMLKLQGYVAGYGIPTDLNFNGAFTVTRTAYPEGWLKSEKDGNGHTTSYVYDAIGRLTKVTPPSVSKPTSYVYAADGSSVKLTRGSYQKTENVDGLGRVTSTLDSENIQTTSHYDSMGRRYFKSYPFTKSDIEVGDKYEFDGLGRVTVRTKAYQFAEQRCDAADGCKETNTYSRNCINTAIERTRWDVSSTTRCNESFGDPDEQRLAGVVDANSNVWRYSYNAAGKLLGVITPRNLGDRAYTYDPVKQFLLSENTHERGAATYQRNEIGQPTRETDARNMVTEFGYDDPLSRLTSIRYLGSSSDDVTKGYDNANNVTKVASNNGGTFSYGYDDVDRLTSQKWTYGGKTYSTAYKYDTAGCLNSITYPTGLTLTITCDTANRVKTISIGSAKIVKNVIYHPSGQVTSMTYGDSAATATGVDYDFRARATSVVAANVMGLSYTYDGDNNVLSFKDTMVPTSKRTMEYDGLNRLVVSIAPHLWGTAVYDYDELGNRKLKSVGSYTNGYSYDLNNRLETISGVSSTPTMTFSWDAAGRLVSSSDGVNYTYDGQGRRIRKATASQAILYHYDGAGRVISETLPDGTKLRDYIYLGNKLIAVDGCMEGISSSGCTERQWYHTDSLGSVLARTDNNGTVVTRFDYQPWGEQWSVAGTSPQGDRQYNGRVYDSGTGFHDYGARLYWPEIGRFISVDSAGPDLANPLSFNRYSYTFNNPYKYTDPDGRNPLIVVGLACAGAGFVGSAVASYLDKGEINWNAATQWAAKGFLIGVTAGLGATMLADSEAASATLATAAGAGATTGATLASGGRHIVLGLRDYGLRETAARVGGDHLLDDANWMQSLMQAIGDKATRFTVSLEGFSGSSTYQQVMGAAQRGLTPAAKATEWEMAQLWQAGRLGAANFVNGAGEAIANPF